MALSPTEDTKLGAQALAYVSASLPIVGSEQDGPPEVGHK
jgi:hypothetical protein